MSVANSSIVQLIKQMAVEAVKASRPCDYIVGNVIGTDPLKIKVSNSLVIEDDFLVKTRNVTDYVQEVGEGFDVSQGRRTGIHCSRQDGGR